MSKRIPATITQLRRAMSGWCVHYDTHIVYADRRMRSYEILCIKKVPWRGAYRAAPKADIQTTNKAAAVEAAYAAMKTMEVRDAD